MTQSSPYTWKHTCGIDESGRGALAGPLVAASVVLTCLPEKIARESGVSIRDGKLLSAIQREKIYGALKKYHAIISIETISVLQVNHRGIRWANREVIRRLIRKTVAKRYIVDGNLKLGSVYGKTNRIQSIVNADATILPVICAGIVAKVERDRIMNHLHTKYPLYNWNTNMGYGTRRHIQTIVRYSSCRYHRSIFVTSALTNYQLHKTISG